MKHLKKTILLSLVVAATFSCSTEEAIKTEEEKSSIANFTATAPQNKLENHLDWVAYITAKIVHDNNNTAERNLLVSLLSTNNTIAIDELLDVSTNPQSSTFEGKFKSLLILAHYGPEPGDGEEEPDPVCDTCEDNNVFYNNFKNYILNDNCVELYFPEGLNLSTNSDVTSVSHPLTSAQQNDGFRRSYGLQYPDNAATSVVVNPFYLIGNDNVIVARPVRDLGVQACDYSDYPGIDFTDFLD